MDRTEPPLAGKVILVVGASTGIGAHVADAAAVARFVHGGFSA